MNPCNIFATNRLCFVFMRTLAKVLYVKMPCDIYDRPQRAPLKKKVDLICIQIGAWRIYFLKSCWLLKASDVRLCINLEKFNIDCLFKLKVIDELQDFKKSQINASFVLFDFQVWVRHKFLSLVFNCGLFNLTTVNTTRIIWHMLKYRTLL